jgi:hypothetical protein
VGNKASVPWATDEVGALGVLSPKELMLKKEEVTKRKSVITH